MLVIDFKFKKVARTLLVMLAAWLGGAQYVPAADRSDDLLQAAVHLERAGLSERAAEIRQLLADQGGEQVQRLLAARQEQFEQLQAEIEQLRQIADPRGPQIRMDICVMRYSMKSLRERGLTLLSFDALAGDGPACVVDDSGNLVQFLKLLTDQRLVEVIAQTTLVTVAGRRAKIEIVAEPKATSTNPATAERPVEETPPIRMPLQIACRPKLEDDGRITLYIDLAGTEQPPPPDKAEQPVDTQVTMASGQTAILTGLHSGDGDKSQASVLAWITPTIIKAEEKADEG